MPVVRCSNSALLGTLRGALAESFSNCITALLLLTGAGESVGRTGGVGEGGMGQVEMKQMRWGAIRLDLEKR